jgi:hypothetical protein
MGKQLVSFITCGCELSAPFLAHLAKGHVSFCHHTPASSTTKTVRHDIAEISVESGVKTPKIKIKKLLTLKCCKINP